MPITFYMDERAPASIGQCINDLEYIAKAGQRDDLAIQVIFLPL